MKLIVLFLVLIIGGCSFLGRSADEHAWNLLGNNAVKCGDVEPEKTSKNVESCIFENLNSKTSFFAYYWISPVDSVPAMGIMLDQKQELYLSWFDGGYIIWPSIFKPEKCERWYVAKKSDKDKVVCVVPIGKEIYLFDLGVTRGARAREEVGTLPG